ncbi:hypothetical protein JNUCC1_03325 [Lentibacillus sp. JNUCC-1]|uniref:hypothetical protein n=1 Tax=Lentibacillus sp. JNUCC-1 TaxID=2654513 RepID=UPI00132C4F95|nr:hypothetical protein [Lentibacillus sp. JNUCC-1]MUV39447.1 hypothetical protein [Lentibacillus sp. JNUCC-1]
MNTLSYRMSTLQSERARDNVIMLEDLEFAISKRQLQNITELHNKGMYFTDISKRVKRDPYEVLLAILHQFKSGKPMKPLGIRLPEHSK